MTRTTLALAALALAACSSSPSPAPPVAPAPPAMAAPTPATERTTADEQPAPAAVDRSTTVDGLRVHWRELGTGSGALVFVHGWGGDVDVWRFQAPVFAPRAHLILIDLPGHGASDKPRVDYTMPFLARAVDGVLEAAGVTRAVLIGHSMGTPVIRQVYRSDPKRVRALVAVDGTFKLPPFFADPASAKSFLARFETGYATAMSAMLDAMTTPHMPPDVKREMKDAFVSTPQHVALSAMRGMIAPEGWVEDPIAVPVLSLLARSPVWTDEYLAYVKRLAPDSEAKFIEDSGHFLMLENPEAFNAALLEYLERRRLLE